MAEMVKAHHSSAVLFLTGLYPQWYQGPLRMMLTLGLATRSAIEQAKYRQRERN